MTKQRTQPGKPAALRLTAGLGLAFPERDYLVWDPFDGERDTGIRCQQTTLRRARQRYTCWGLLGEQDHEIQPGDLYRHEKGFADGRWGCYRLCIGCMDKWLTEIDRAPASPNVAGNRLARQGQSELTGVLGGPIRSEKE